VSAEDGTGLGKRLGRYVLFDEIGAGGMGSVHLARLDGPSGFSRTVAIKRLHPHVAKDPEFAAMFLDEARLAARIAHPNVISTLDVVQMTGELFVVMEYVHGESLARLWRTAHDRGERIPVATAVSVLIDVLDGLHAAHEAKDVSGRPLEIVHRDVSPQNVLVGRDGLARVLDFGIARARSRIYATMPGQLKGKLGYMAPEQLMGETMDRRTDIFAASVVLWELLTGRRLFDGDPNPKTIAAMLVDGADSPSRHASEIPEALDAVVLRGLAREKADRYATADAMARALESAITPSRRKEIGDWVERIAGEALEASAARLELAERVPSSIARAASPSESAIATEGLVAPGSERSKRSETSSTFAGRRRAPLMAAVAIVAIVSATTIVVEALRTRSDPSIRQGGAPAPEVASSAPPTASSSTIAASSPAEVPVLPSAPVRSTTIVRPFPVAARPAATPKKSKADCNPPYSIEADGTKRFKPECIH
jgi:serine/threonine-protein kinase